MITGRYRLDIAPGSLIQLNSAGDLFDQSHETVFASVSGVDISIGNQGQGSYAHTSFQLTNIRSNTEHQKFTTPDHPLYDGAAWRGGKLVKM